MTINETIEQNNAIMELNPNTDHLELNPSSPEDSNKNKSSRKDYLYETNGTDYVLTKDPIKVVIKNHKFVKHFEAQVQINGICYKPCETVFLSRTLEALLDYIRIEARTEKFQQFVGVIEKNRFVKALDKWFPYA
jgi:hypothetical protein